MPEGPCSLCGATNYPASMGGPTICPACDCGDDKGRIRRLVKQDERAWAIVALLVKGILEDDTWADGWCVVCHEHNDTHKNDCPMPKLLAAKGEAEHQGD